MSNEPKQGGVELLVYQIGELKNLIENLNLKMDAYQDKIERRVAALELWQASEVGKTKKAVFDMDWQRLIIMGLGLLVSILALMNAHIVK